MPKKDEKLIYEKTVDFSYIKRYNCSNFVANIPTIMILKEVNVQRINLITTVVLVSTLLIMVSCATLPLDAPQVDKPISMTPKVGSDYEVQKHFSVESRALWVFALATLSTPDVGEIVNREASGADAVANLKITKQMTVVDWAISVLTAGVLYSETVTIEGDAVKIR